MYIVGLTGSIACGKSTVTTRLRSHHKLAVIDLDELARLVVEPGQPAYDKLKAEFGAAAIFKSDGSLDRAKLGNLVFNDRVLRKKLNSITHWPILWMLLRKMAAARASGVNGKYIVCPCCAPARAISNAGELFHALSHRVFHARGASRPVPCRPLLTSSRHERAQFWCWTRLCCSRRGSASCAVPQW